MLLTRKASAVPTLDLNLVWSRTAALAYQYQAQQRTRKNLKREGLPILAGALLEQLDQRF